MYDMEVCVDCAMLHANGSTEGLEGDRLTEVIGGLAEYPFLAIGDAAGFSWSACDACGSRLGGDRLEAAMV